MRFYHTVSFHSITVNIFDTETQIFVIIGWNMWLEIVINIPTYSYCSDSNTGILIK